MTSEDSEVTESVYEDMKTYKLGHGLPANPRRSRRKKMRRTGRWISRDIYKYTSRYIYKYTSRHI